jgi:hypothetical protein
MSLPIRIWQIEWRDAVDSDNIFDKQNVVAHTASEALLKAKPRFVGCRIVTSVKLLAATS